MWGSWSWSWNLHSGASFDMDNTTNQVDTSTEAARDEYEKADKEKDEHEDNAIGLGIQRSNNVIKLSGSFSRILVFVKTIVQSMQKKIMAVVLVWYFCKHI